jgi:hypothetical protein
MTGGMWIGHDHHRQPERGDFSQCGGARPTDHHVGPGQNQGHLLVQVLLGPVARPQVGRQRIPAGNRLIEATLAGDVDYPRPLDQSRQRLGDRRVEAPDLLRPAEDQ